MKKLVVVFLVLAMLAVTFTTAAAGGNGPGYGGGAGTGTGTGTQQAGPRGTFAITGNIVAIGTNTVTVQVVRGNKLVQPFIGTPVTVTVNAQTKYLYRTSATGTATYIKFADLKLGQPVSVNGTVANDVWTAQRITVGATLSCLP